MKKELKDYAHFYIGCDVLQDDNEIARLVGIYAETCMLIHEATGQFGECDISKIKLILRHLSDLTEEEMIYCVANGQLVYCGQSPENFVIGWGAFRPEITRFLLSKSFDLFGLIKAGLAIDATTLKQKS